MSAREAAVRLTLDGAQFMVAIKGAGDAVDKTASRGKKSMSALDAGIGAAKRSMRDLGGAAKNTLKMIASFGGAFAVGAAVKAAVSLQASYSQLAFRVQTATGELVKANDIQKLIERSAANTGRTNEEMAASFGDIFQATGELDFSREVLESIGTAATATGADVGTLTSLADQLHTKFNVSAGAMKEVFAQVIGLKDKGGPKLEEFTDIMGTVGAEMLAAGLDGKRGLDFMLGALITTDDRAGGLGKQVRGLKMLLRGLGDTGELKKLAAKLAIDPKKLINEKDAIARLRTVFSKGKKGIDALLEPMAEGEEKETLRTLFVKPFEKALEDAQKSQLKGKAAIDKALTVFDAQIGAFGKSNLDAAGLQRRASAAMQEPQALLTAAINNLNTAFAAPEIIQGINDLAKHLPALAKTVGDVVNWILKNPITSTAIGLGVKGATSVVPAVLGAVLSGGAAAAGAGGAAAGAGAAAAGSAGVFGMGAGATGLAAVALPAAIFAAIAAGGLIMKEQIGNAFDDEEALMKELASATAAAFGGGGSLEEQKAKLARLQKANQAVGEANVGGGVMDSVARGILHNADAPDSREQAKEQMKLAGQAIAKRHIAIQKLEKDAAEKASMPGAAEAVAVKAPAVKIEPAAAHMIGVAVATAMGGKVLDMRLVNAGEIGGGRPVPGGSRGPLNIPPAAPGGGR